MKKARLTLGLAACLGALAGCNIEYTVVDDTPNANEDGSVPSGGDNGDSAGRGGAAGVTGGSAGVGGGGVGGSSAMDPEICSRGGRCERLLVEAHDRLDLLLVVDDSGSLRDEQFALQEQVPNMVRALTSGDVDGDGTQDVPRARDLHVGVVSTDLGLSGITGIPLCNGLGDDGVLSTGSCELSSGKPFIEYVEGGDLTPDDVALELSCLVELGTQGCGFEQQLESALKAVWPADDMNVWFLPDPAGFGTSGQGGPLGANGDFLRTDPDDLSTLAIVLLTDEEDCSSNNMSHFRPDNGTLAPDDPLKLQGLNTRCFFESQLDRDPGADGVQNNLYSPARYIEALRALRPGAEERVVFAAIVAVPPDLVEPEDLASVDFGDPADGRAFYDAILADARMTQTLDDRGTVEVADDNLVPSCDRGADAKGYPPRRIVETVAGFGSSGVVQSICQDDFAPALEVITRRIGERMGSTCLGAPLHRDNAGKVACDVVWQLPLTGEAPASTPTRCDERGFLSLRAASDGRELCTVEQAALEGAEPEPDVEGFFWDTASSEALLCGERGLIQFTSEAEPPAGVNVYLDCAVGPVIE